MLLILQVFSLLLNASGRNIFSQVQAREGIGPIITSIGEEAVSNALVATCRARIYLEEDNLDVRFIAVREPVEKTGGDGITSKLASMKVRLYVEEV